MKPFSGVAFIRTGVYEKQKDGALGSDDLLGSDEEILLIDASSVEEAKALLKSKLKEVRSTWNDAKK